MADVGNVGSYVPSVVGEGTLNELRDLAGPAPSLGKKHVIVNLDTGEMKWYQSARRSYRRRSYRSYRRY